METEKKAENLTEYKEKFPNNSLTNGELLGNKVAEPEKEYQNPSATNISNSATPEEIADTHLLIKEICSTSKLDDKEGLVTPKR